MRGFCFLFFSPNITQSSGKKRRECRKLLRWLAYPGRTQWDLSRVFDECFLCLACVSSRRNKNDGGRLVRTRNPKQNASHPEQLCHHSYESLAPGHRKCRRTSLWSAGSTAAGYCAGVLESLTAEQSGLEAAKRFSVEVALLLCFTLWFVQGKKWDCLLSDGCCCWYNSTHPSKRAKG